MRTFRLESLIVLLLFHISCEKKEINYQVQDLVFVGEFTKGLEGPAIDGQGNLFFVNPSHNGSVGKVDTDGNFGLFI